MRISFKVRQDWLSYRIPNWRPSSTTSPREPKIWCSRTTRWRRWSPTWRRTWKIIRKLKKSWLNVHTSAKKSFKSISNKSLNWIRRSKIQTNSSSRSPRDKLKTPSSRILWIISIRESNRLSKSSRRRKVIFLCKKKNISNCWRRW